MICKVCPEYEARGIFREIYYHAFRIYIRDFYIRFVFFLDWVEINHSYTKYEGKNINSHTGVRKTRIGSRYVSSQNFVDRDKSWI